MRDCKCSISLSHLQRFLPQTFGPPYIVCVCVCVCVCVYLWAALHRVCVCVCVCMCVCVLTQKQCKHVSSIIPLHLLLE
uniref:Uncharacterized protein n=1 Tax=Rhinopithecus bieti TaxID=61621 RepID=A0A2K6L3H6_RHIBE